MVNKTFEKAFNELSESERRVIFSGVSDPEKTEREDNQLWNGALVRLFIILRDREQGDLDNLTPFEERVLNQSVVAGNAFFETDTYR